MTKTDETLSIPQIEREIGLAFNNNDIARAERFELLLRTQQKKSKFKNFGERAAEEDRQAAAIAARRQQQADDTAKCAALGTHQNEIASKIDAGITALRDLMDELRATHIEIRQVAMGVKHPLGTDDFLEMLTVYARRNINLAGFMGRVAPEDGPTMAQASTGWTDALLNELRQYLVAEGITPAQAAA